MKVSRLKTRKSFIEVGAGRSLPKGCRFNGDCHRAFCPARFVRAMATAGAATASAPKMKLAREDQKAAFPVKILFFDQLFHTCRLRLNSNCQRAAGSL